MDNSMKRKHTNKHKSLNHNPQAESVKAVFGEPKAKDSEFIPKTFD
jgi:hypothetical protein